MLNGGVRIAAPTTVPASSRTATYIAGAGSLVAPVRRAAMFVTSTLWTTGSLSRKVAVRSQNVWGSAVASQRMSPAEYVIAGLSPGSGLRRPRRSEAPRTRDQSGWKRFAISASSS